MTQTKPDSLYVRQLPLGPMKNFVYLVGPPTGRDALVIDPAWDVPAILSAAEADGRVLVGAFVTHHHADHVNGLPALLAAKELPVYAQRDEVAFAPVLRDLGDVLRPVAPGEVVTVGGLPVTCVHTPGHTVGSQCLSCGGALFSGDTLFVNACGRCDLPGGDAGVLRDSLFDVLGRLGDETVLYPGHDYGDVPVSSLGRERARNPYFRTRTRDEFIALRSRPRGA